MLKAFVELACQHGHGVPVKFLAVEQDGIGVTRETGVGSDGVIQCWTASMSEAVAVKWDQAVLDDDRLFPKSSRHKTKLHDFILWALEPLPLNSRDRDLKNQRSLLSVPALTLVTYIAGHMETSYFPEFMKTLVTHDQASSAFQMHVRTGTKRRRTATLTTNVICARAAMKLFSGEAGQCFQSGFQGSPKASSTHVP